MENIVLAKVGNKQITKDDFEFFKKGLNPQVLMQFNSEEGQKRLLQELVNQELFYLDAIDNKLNEDPEYIKEIERIKAGFLKQYAINKVVMNVTVTNEELKTYYEENKDLFKSEEMAKASHILVDTQEKANEIIDEINSGLSFEEAATKYSNCPSSAQGGDLGIFPRGRMVPEFEEAVFSMNIGQISHPVKTQFGYHIIKLSDKKEAGYKTFDEVKNQISQQLIAQKQEKAYLDKINELKGKYEIVVNE
ncbi:peptidyl-prolyl cis-trans isomerase C [Alkalithermobacter thermoalcaliphilus JW-YL-7 = DSM 7308]|uniref:Peptidyl-prolyl cis-trans isomerase C n=1 Tax=Alkalithermobacter thermoalcaliphilus JW-YL-7 = DSM 7308 TaxID=1121328 RepID=A0A150FSU6_CLOPD|nr:PpiC-type peptidyl-prolyl cis-trans isomerase [[Clostridium] paradoxum JW-YL-7 = DSM 7308]SHL18378.1 peptidyl-prolyl cis-trans isomerase C [[Clostridium] paradoxum JW-YL-7 = DSM 7308]